MKYEEAIFKIPLESDNYKENSDFICKSIKSIIDLRIKEKTNRILWLLVEK